MKKRICALLWLLLRDAAAQCAAASPELMHLCRAIPLCFVSFLLLLSRYPALEDWLALLTLSGLAQVFLWILIIGLSSAILLILWGLLLRGKSLLQHCADTLWRVLSDGISPLEARCILDEPPAYRSAGPRGWLRTCCLLFVCGVIPFAMIFVLYWPDALAHLDVLGLMTVCFPIVMQMILIPVIRIFRAAREIGAQYRRLMSCMTPG